MYEQIFIYINICPSGAGGKAGFRWGHPSPCPSWDFSLQGGVAGCEGPAAHTPNWNGLKESDPPDFLQLYSTYIIAFKLK